MIPSEDQYYFVHDEEGHVLAVVQRASVRTDDGTEIGVRPEPLAGQSVVEGALPGDAGSLHELLETFDLRVDLATGQVIARRRDASAS